MKNTCKICWCLFCCSDHNEIYTYDGSVSGKNPWGMLVMIVFDFTKILPSMRITFQVRISGQRSSNALMIFISSVIAENP